MSMIPCLGHSSSTMCGGRLRGFVCKVEDNNFFGNFETQGWELIINFFFTYKVVTLVRYLVY